jgi:hypothetical protein
MKGSRWDCRASEFARLENRGRIVAAFEESGVDWPLKVLARVSCSQKISSTSKNMQLNGASARWLPGEDSTSIQSRVSASVKSGETVCLTVCPNDLNPL